MIRIMKASAGSGKTWNLTRHYIRLMLERKDPHAYRHILAVTFTNKATDEMKERILNELHTLSVSPCNSGYYSDFVPSMFPDATSLAEASGNLLCGILHDYSAFAVSTIDSFFQHTLKAFAKEIGYFSSYAIELDKDSLINESVDIFLDSLTESDAHARSLEWMTSKTLNQLEEGEGFRLDYTLRKIAARFNSEEFRLAVEKAGIDETYLYSDERLKKLEEGCEAICLTYVRMLSDAAGNVIKAFDAAGIDPYDTTRHFMSVTLGKYGSLKAGAYVQMISDSFRNNASDVTKWFPKPKRHLESQVTPEMENAVSAFLSLFGPEYKVYNTALQLKKQIYGFAVANDLYGSFKALLKEKNVLTIDRTNTLLRQIIDGSDTPFIYEKLGVRYDHFLLDEFQDTSQVQWENFRPLLQNSVAGGNENLIVGDVKQSIYRWRQSEWDLLENKVEEEFSDSSEVETLDANFRSCQEIVSFNNECFKAAAGYLSRLYGDGGEVIARIYSDVGQKVRKNLNGMVELSFREDGDVHQGIYDAICKAVEAGFRYGDVAILVRVNREGGEIAKYLMEKGIPVVSDDSLKIASSVTVRRLVSLLAGIENPEDSVSCYLASSLGVEVPSKWNSLIDLAENILRELARTDNEMFCREMLYIQSFMDLMQDYVSSEGNDLMGFLKKWAEDKSDISSPKSSDSVRIMTVHKSKGLDFPYVIFPSLDGVSFYSFTEKWSRPDVEGTSLEGVADGIYDVYLSNRSDDTLFADSFREEKLKQYVDNLNILYVAFTRASHAMTVISGTPFGKGNENSAPGMFSSLAGQGLLDGFEQEVSENGTVTYRKGNLNAPVHEDEVNENLMVSSFVSWPLNPEPSDDPEVTAGERGRLKFSSDSADFFAGSGEAGIASSNRIRGVVLHEILSRVMLPEDLHASVRQSLLTGQLTDSEAEEVEDMLASSLSRVMDRGWFPDDRKKVLNETAIIDSDGKIYRPDRVICDGDRVIVVDFKFGVHDDRYIRQVRRYVDLWRRMGHAEVSGFLWYLPSGEIVEV